MSEPVIVLAWLVLAHLAADFVLQTEWMATEKFKHSRRARVALSAHVAVVGLCLVPFVLAYGVPGAGLLGVVTLGHWVIDRTKIRITRAVEARALREAGLQPEPSPELHGSPQAAGGTPAEPSLQPEASAPDQMDRTWTAMPAFLFVADQGAHLALMAAAWWALLARAPVSDGWSSAVSGLGGADLAAFHRVVLTAVVGAALLIVNTKAGSLFVVTLVRPRATVTGQDGAAGPRRGPPPEKVGQAVGVLERLLVVIFVLLQAEAAIGLVVAAKTVARFKQLDDREFAEYYLLGTLASISVAIFSGLLALAALS
ncbi:MAG TPA: DUF3307 domain-containing protein [Candidatus Limnocylindrales bacterium]|nr:DUF3307 domain-containing protein [Candidatus Limnocylindrales bacterium]